MKYYEEQIGNIIFSERKKLGMSQEKLGMKIGIVGKQISNYEKGKTIPPIDVMFKLCEVFNCELGHLLGESDYTENTKLETIITNATGLSLEAINTIRIITGSEKTCLDLGHESDTYRALLNSLLSSSLFISFIECLHELDELVSDSKKVFEDVEKKIGKEQFNDALEIYSSPIDYEHDLTIPKPNQEQYRAINMIDKAIDKQCDDCYKIKVARYELYRAFEELIEELYPC